MPTICQAYQSCIPLLCLSSLPNCTKNSFLDHLGTPKAQALPYNPSLAGVQPLACTHWKEAHLASFLSLGILSKPCTSLTQCLPNFLPLSWVLYVQPYCQSRLILRLAFCLSDNRRSLFQLPARLLSSRPNSKDSSRRRDSKVTRISVWGAAGHSHKTSIGTYSCSTLPSSRLVWPWATECISFRLLRRKWRSQCYLDLGIWRIHWWNFT